MKFQGWKQRFDEVISHAEALRRFRDFPVSSNEQESARSESSDGANTNDNSDASRSGDSKTERSLTVFSVFSN